MSGITALISYAGIAICCLDATGKDALGGNHCPMETDKPKMRLFTTLCPFTVTVDATS